MLSMSGGIEELGSVRLELLLCLLACWVFCFFTIWKGVRSSGKVSGNSPTLLPSVMKPLKKKKRNSERICFLLSQVAYFTATFPYVMLLILLIRGLTLPGAFDGIYFYLYPSLEDLASLEVL